MTKNQKISKSLKNYHRTKRTLKSAKKIFIFIAVVAWLNFIVGIQAKAPEARQWGLPQARGRELSVIEQIRQIAKEECGKRDLDSYCINDLVAMAWTESRFDSNAIGDNGASHGLYQIHLGYHKHIAQEQARDIRFSIKWTLNRMEHYGYPVYRSYAIMKHNGTPNTPNTLRYLASVNNYK